MVNKICWIFWIPQGLINNFRILSSKFFFHFMNKLKVSVSMYNLAVKLILLPQNSSKSNFFLKCCSRQNLRSLRTNFFNFYFVGLKIYAINLHLFFYFSVYFSEKFLVKSAKTMVYLKRAHLFLSEYIFFIFCDLWFLRYLISKFSILLKKWTKTRL